MCTCREASPIWVLLLVAMVKNDICVPLTLALLVHSLHSKRTLCTERVNWISWSGNFFVVVFKSKFRVKHRVCWTSFLERLMQKYNKFSGLGETFHLACQVFEISYCSPSKWGFKFPRDHYDNNRAAKTLLKTNWGTIRQKVRRGTEREQNVSAEFI